MTSQSERRGRYDKEDIRAHLVGALSALIPAIYPNAQRSGNIWQLGGIDGARGQSFSIFPDGNGHEFSSGDHYDIFELIKYSQKLRDFGEVMDWAASWCGLSGCDNKEFKIRTAAATAKAKKQTEKAILDRAAKEGKARAMWLYAEKSLLNTPAEDYFANRGIILSQLRHIPGALRFKADMLHPYAGEKYPCILAWAGTAHKQLGCHRTYLEKSSGVWRKLSWVNDKGKSQAKLMYGTGGGVLIPINPGITGRPLGKCPPGSEIILTEGIEDALSLSLACPDERIAAVCNLGNFASVVLPDNISAVKFLKDNDGDNSQAAKGWQKAVEAHHKKGRIVREIIVPADFKDVNDWLRGLKK